jgi:hypothetical protein
MSHVKTRHWRATPPEPPRPYDGGSGGGGGEHLWWFLALLHGALGLALAVGTVYLVRTALQRPFPFVAATAGALAFFVYSKGRAWIAHEERYSVRPMLGAIVGGILGEALSYAVLGLPPHAPDGALWVALGAGGIGGAVGVAVGVYVILGIATVEGSVALYTGWRAR